MVSASTTIASAATAWDGSKAVTRKPKPVALVANAAARKSAFHIGKGFELINPITTMIPEANATRLNAVCTVVKVARSTIMMPSPLQRRRHQFRLAPLSFGGFEVELDLHAVGIKQEQLIETLVIDAAFLEIDALRPEMFDRVREPCGAKRYVIDDTRADGGSRLLAEIFQAVLRHLGATLSKVKHVGISKIEPVDWKLEIWGRADSHPEHVYVPVLGPFQILGLNQKMLQVVKRHGIAP